MDSDKEILAVIITKAFSKGAGFGARMLKESLGDKELNPEKVNKAAEPVIEELMAEIKGELSQWQQKKESLKNL